MFPALGLTSFEDFPTMVGPVTVRADQHRYCLIKSNPCRTEGPVLIPRFHSTAKEGMSVFEKLVVVVLFGAVAFFFYALLTLGQRRGAEEAILSQIGSAPDGLPQKDLQARLALSAERVAPILRRLEDTGKVTQRIASGTSELRWFLSSQSIR